MRQRVWKWNMLGLVVGMVGLYGVAYGAVTWTQVATSGPTPRQGHGLVYDSTQEVTVLFEGAHPSDDGTGVDDTWEWDGTILGARYLVGNLRFCWPWR